jgi:hypothetical protein
MKVLYLSSPHEKSGIGRAGRDNAQALLARHEVVNSLQTGVNAIVQHRAAIAFVGGPPHMRWPAATRQGIPTVGYCVIEGDRTRRSIDERVDQLAQLWTPSRASADALTASGVKQPVKIIPHVLWPFQSLHSCTADTPFTVLTCGHLVEIRKGQEFAYQMFQKAFPAEEFPDVRWIVKTRVPDSRLPPVFAQMINEDPRITVIARDVPNMQDIYDMGHVLLSAHLAGAFELHLAEAAAYGMPVIASATGGPLDYLHSSSLISIAEQREFVLPRYADPFNNSRMWDVPDVAAGAEKLRACYANYEQHRIIAQVHAPVVRQHCAPTRVASLMDAALNELPRVTWHPNEERKATALKFSCAAGVKVETCGIKTALTRVGIHSHRRSGTHFTGAMIEQGWGCAWAKSHALDARALPDGIEWIHTVRNPIDCIYKTWRWWTAEPPKGSFNKRIQRLLSDLTFEQFLDGKGGQLFGWMAHDENDPRGRRRDDLGDLTGYFYDPLRYWIDHLRQAMMYPRMPILVYERLLQEPGLLEEALTPWLSAPKAPLEVPDRPVGHGPHMDGVGHALQFWPDQHLQRLKQELAQPFDQLPAVITHLGFESLEAWLAVGSKASNSSEEPPHAPVTK